MRLEEDLYDCLKDIIGGLSALIAPQNQKTPYSVYQIVSDIKTNSLDKQCDLKQVRYQVDVYSDDLFVCMTIRDDVEAKLLAYDGFSAIIYQTFSNVTDEGRTFQATIDFKLTK